MIGQTWRLTPRMAALGLLSLLWMLGGCRSESRVDSDSIRVWGGRGIGPGEFIRPRAIAISAQDELYIVDKMARIQVFSADGEYRREWRMPEYFQGKPCGLTFSNDGLLMVADTHYFRVLFFTPEGQCVPERTLGGQNGRGPGEFGFVTDVVQDEQGGYWVADYGDYDRIQHFSESGEFRFDWGGHGTEPAEFLRPQSLAMAPDGHLWVADACNHRLQVFDVSGEQPVLKRVWGRSGADVGEIRYPYSILFDDDGGFYLCELGNHRIQKFDRDGQVQAVMGRAGRQAGEFSQPWSMVRDRRGVMHVLDTYNDRVQSFVFEEVATAVGPDVDQAQEALPER